MDQRLQEDREKFDTSANDDTGNIDWLLSKDRKNQDLDVTTEKQMKDEGKWIEADTQITEKQINESKGAFSKGTLPSNPRDDKGKHPMSYHKKHEEDFVKALKKAQEKVKDDFKMPKPGSQMLGDKPNKVKVDTRSQLTSNFKDGEELRKENPCVKNASAEMVSQIKDADAMLYHIYRSAAVASRDLTATEKKMAEDINSGKRRILAQLLPMDQNAPVNDAASDQFDMQADDAVAEHNEMQDVNSQQEKMWDIEYREPGGEWKLVNQEPLSMSDAKTLREQYAVSGKIQDPTSGIRIVEHTDISQENGGTI